MGNAQQSMPVVNFKDEKLKSAYLYSKYVEAKNFERSEFALKSLKKSRKLSACLGVIVLGIYSYTIIKIKQETFLDDFEEPQRIVAEN